MVQTMDSPPFDLQGYEPPVSLWRLIQQHVLDHEREEIKNMLGESLIDQSIELHLEIDTLLDIWRDYRAETTSATPPPNLPEPPGLRGRLIQEIQFFVENVKEKAKNNGVNPDKILSRHNTEILDYALETNRSDSGRGMSRPMTARSTDGRETPMMISPALSSERTSMTSTFSEDIDSMNDRLNVLRFDEVVAHLRSTLEEEVETLLKDINFLQNCLDDEATFRAESTGTLSREPTLAELSEERTTLEKEMFANITVQTSPPIKAAFTPASVIKPLGSGVKIPGRLKTPVGATSSPNPGPLKAFTSTVTKQCQPSSSHTPSGHHHGIDSKTPHHGRVQSSTGTERQSRVSSGHGRHRTASDKDSNTFKLTLPSNDKHSSNAKLSRTNVSSKPIIGTLVTLSKDSSGDSAAMQRIPTPPSSGKPSSPRPGSAQRFRKMVQDCRD